MALNIPDLTTKWGHIFGGINEFDTFRGTTVNNRANTISADYVTAAQQRLAASDLYPQMAAVDANLQTTVQYFINFAQGTLQLAAIQDTEFPINTTDNSILFQKLLNDMIFLGDTFQLPTVAIGGADSIDATPVTTLEGAPYGNGTIVGTIIEPRTGVVRVYSYIENISLVCSADSYTDGVTAGQESFTVATYAFVDPLDSLWSKGSGVNTTFQSQPSNNSNLYKNAYFEDWETAPPNTLSDWTTANLTPSVDIFQVTDAYTGTYAVKLTAAGLNAEIFQPLSGLAGAANYLAGIRVKNLTAITGGVLTYALRDATGTILNDAAGNPLSFAIALTGLAGNYILTWQVFSIPRGFPDIVNLSIKITTAMNAAESIEIDTAELPQMQNLYVGGPDIGFLPGSVSWADNDSYMFTVTNSADNLTFVRNIQRVYPTIAPQFDLPVSLAPTVSDALIT